MGEKRGELEEEREKRDELERERETRGIKDEESEKETGGEILKNNRRV